MGNKSFAGYNDWAYTYLCSLVPRLLVGGEKKSLVSTVRACA